MSRRSAYAPVAADDLDETRTAAANAAGLSSAFIDPTLRSQGLGPARRHLRRRAAGTVFRTVIMPEGVSRRPPWTPHHDPRLDALADAFALLLDTGRAGATAPTATLTDMIKTT